MPRTAEIDSDGRLSRGHHTRTRLIESAGREFALVGFEGASVRVIAKNARIAFQLVDYHFGSKEELWKAVVQHLFEQAVLRCASLTPPRHSSPDEQLRALLKSSILDAQRESTFLRIVSLEAMDASDRYKKVLIPMCQTLHQLLGSVLGQFKEFSGHAALSPTESRILYNAFVFANALVAEDSSHMLGKSISDPAAIDAQIDLLASLLQRGQGPCGTGRGRRSHNLWPDSPHHTPPVAPARSAIEAVANHASPDRLLLAAVDVFAEKGYEAASVREIAERAQVAFQLIRYHFGSKSDLWLTVLTYLLDQRHRALHDSHFATDGDHSMELEIWLRRAVFYSYHENKFQRIWVRERLSNSQHFIRSLLPRVNEVQSLIMSSFKEMHEVGVLRGLRVEEAGFVFFALGPASAMQPQSFELTTGWSIQDPMTTDFLVSLLARLLSGGKYGPTGSHSGKAQVHAGRLRRTPARKA